MPHTYRYSLDRVRDVHGNDMTFEYQKVQGEFDDPPVQYDQAGYLQRIRYTGNDVTGLSPQREVVFVTSNRAVKDYPDPYSGGPSYPDKQHFFLKKKLDRIEVRVDGALVRQYDFDYRHEDKNGDDLYAAHRLLLESITRLGSDGVTPLITTTFTYHDLSDFSTWQRLGKGSNSYGASVSYEYDSIILEDKVQRVRVVQRTVSDGDPNHDRVYGYDYGTPRVAGGEFRGHDVVAVTLPNDELSVHHFNQGLSDEPLKGRPERVEKYDDQAGLQSIQENAWQYEPTGGGANFVYLRTMTETIGLSSPVAVQYSYDDYGNLSQVYERGDPNTTADDRYRALTYTVSTDAWIVNCLEIEEVYDYQKQTRVARTEYYYDGHTLGVAPEKGDLTKVRRVDLVNDNHLVTEYDHDAYGNVTQVTDGKGYTTTTAYETTYHTFPETVIHPVQGLSTTSHYTAHFGLVEWFTDLNGQTTHYEYDVHGRLRKVWASLDYGSGTPTVEYVYTPTSSGLEVQTQRKEAYGSSSTYDTVATYDGLGQLVQTTAEGEGGSIYVDYQYDSLGRQWKVSAPYTDTAQLWTETTYDALGRLKRVTNTDGTYQQYTYTGWEQVVVRDENGHYKGYGRDAFGRTVQVDEYNEGYPGTPYTTTYSYDLLGNLISVEDNLDHTTVITYDSLGRKLAMDDADMGDWSYAYDLNGNLETQTDASGTVITFTYDALDRLTGKSYSDPDTAPVTYTYDVGINGKGQRTEMVDGSGSTAWGYDALGRVVTETRVVDGAGYVTAWSYDPLGRVTSMTYPDPSTGSGQGGEVVTYTYNAQGLVETMVGLNDYVGSVDYNALGQTTRLELGNGLTTTYDYYDLNDGPDKANFRLESVATTGGLQNLSYTYDDVGNVQTMADTVGGLNLGYAYDELDRLTGVSGTYARSYGYNSIGNLTNKNGLTLTYNDSNHPHAVSGTSEGWTFDYSPTGNVMTRTVSGQEITFGYDAENRLTQVVSDVAGSAVTTTFVYDGDGRRVKKMDESGTTVYIGEHYEEVRHETIPWQELLDEWRQVTGAIPYHGITDFEEFKGDLYAGGGNIPGYLLSVVRLVDPDLASQWEEAGRFGTGAKSLASWEDYLWAAEGYFLGGDLYRSSDGTNWEAYDSPTTLSNRVFAPGDGNLYESGEQSHMTYKVWIKTGLESAWSVVYNGDGYAMAMGPDGLHMGVGDDFEDPQHEDKERIVRKSGSGWVTEREDDWPDGVVKDFVLASGVLYATVTGEDRPLREVNGVWEPDDYPVVEGSEPKELEYYGGYLFCTVENKLFVREESGWTAVYTFTYEIKALGEFNGFLFVGTKSNTYRRSWRNAPLDGKKPQPPQVTKHYHANGQRVAMRQGDVVYYVHGDHLGSTVAVSDQDGQAVGRVQYDPWGTVISSTLPVTLTDRFFTGQRWHGTIGLYQMGARWYDPALGRWLQADTMVPEPGNPQALNRYSYVLGNPLRYIDPSGHQVVPLLIGLTVATAIWLAYPRIAEAPALGEVLTPPDYDPGYGDKAFLDSAPGTGDLSDAWALFTRRRLFTGDPQNRLEAGIFTLLPFVPGGIRSLRHLDEAGDAFRFTSRSDEIFEVGRRMGPTEEMHWIPRKFHERLKKLYPEINRKLLDYTEPLELGFHKLVHGKWGTRADSYNDLVRQWLNEYGGIKSLDDFLQYIDELRSNYLDLYEQYLTGG